LFREVNERVQYVNADFALAGSYGDWICECANNDCTQRIEMTPEEYEEIRGDGARFFVLPSNEHVWPDVERVVRRTRRYWVVEKSGRARDGATRLDPRTRQGPLPLRT
jgi:hypothetical protein